MAPSSRESGGLSSALNVPVRGSLGSAKRMPLVAPFSQLTGPAFHAPRMSGDLPWSKQLTLWSGAIPALHAPGLVGTGRRSTPISPDGSLPWSLDAAHGGWSARMFLHQMLSTSRAGWQPSDTELLLSLSTLAISPLRVAGGSSLSDALLSTAPDSRELYLTPAMVAGLARRASSRKRPLQRVLLRTPQGWRRRTVMCTSRGGDFAFSIPSKRKLSKDSPETGLLGFLVRVVAEWSATPSTSGAPDGSAGAS